MVARESNMTRFIADLTDKPIVGRGVGVAMTTSPASRSFLIC